jgi:hypothetical protein
LDQAVDTGCHGAHAATALDLRDQARRVIAADVTASEGVELAPLLHRHPGRLRITPGSLDMPSPGAVPGSEAESESIVADARSVGGSIGGTMAARNGCTKEVEPMSGLGPRFLVIS